MPALSSIGVLGLAEPTLGKSIPCLSTDARAPPLPPRQLPWGVWEELCRSRAKR